jgi:hypothetical protein
MSAGTDQLGINRDIKNGSLTNGIKDVNISQFNDSAGQAMHDAIINGIKEGIKKNKAEWEKLFDGMHLKTKAEREKWLEQLVGKVANISKEKEQDEKTKKESKGGFGDITAIWRNAQAGAFGGDPAQQTRVASLQEMKRVTRLLSQAVQRQKNQKDIKDRQVFAVN